MMDSENVVMGIGIASSFIVFFITIYFRSGAF